MTKEIIYQDVLLEGNFELDGIGSYEFWGSKEYDVGNWILTEWCYHKNYKEEYQKMLNLNYLQGRKLKEIEKDIEEKFYKSLE